MQRLVALGLTCAGAVWLAALLIAPSGAGGPAARHISAFAYGTGSLICHQRPERSFHLSGIRVPVCARCTALYVLGALGATAGWIGRPRVPRFLRGWLVAALVPVALSVGLEWAGLWGQTNAVRAASAVPLGWLAGWLFVRMLRADEPVSELRYDFPL